MVAGLKGNKTHFLLLAGFACYFLFTLFQPFLHVHVVDGHGHDDCDACLWFVVSAGIFIFLFGLCMLFRVLARQEEFFSKVFISRTDFPPPSRSPPLS